MRRSRLILIASSIAAVLLVGCGSITRTEKDVYTITKIDTTVIEQVRNQPGERDNGIIYPSSRTIVMERNMVQRDSVVEREYPNFIRLGLFEGIGLIGSGLGGESVNAGLFGLYFDIDRILTQKRQSTEGNIFKGSIYRFGIGEWKLHWFDDEPGWSYGFTAWELIRPDDDLGHYLNGAGVLNIKKRWYLKNTIPYLALSAQASFAFLPSQYVNLSGSAELGSIGGLNLRLYAGYAFGMSGFVTPGSFVNFPYLGVGASVLDFLNKDEELNVEWKYHEHSSWAIGLAEFMLVGANTDASLFAPRKTGSDKPAVTGFTARFCNATIALPFLDYKLSLGTSLINIVAPGNVAFGIGVLPIRASIVLRPIGPDFVVEPFAEYNYAPSTFTHAGARLTLPVNTELNVLLTVGYVSGSTGSLRGYDWGGEHVNNPLSFDAFYLGIGVTLWERLFHREELRYGRNLPHE